MYGCSGSDYLSSTQNIKQRKVVSPYTLPKLFSERCDSFLLKHCSFKMQVNGSILLGVLQYRSRCLHKAIVNQRFLSLDHETRVAKILQ